MRLCYKCSLHFSTPLRLRGRTGVFRRREGCLLAGPSRTPPSSCSSCLPFLLYEASPHAEVRRMRIHASCGSALPSPASTSSFPESRLCARCTCTGADGCVFPSATAGDFMHRIAYVIALARLFRGAFVFWGGRDVFSRSRLSTTSSPLLSSPTLLLATSSRSTGMVSTDTVFWHGSGSLTVQSLNVVSWMQEHWSVLSSIQVLNHKRSFQSMPRSLCFLCETRNKERC